MTHFCVGVAASILILTLSSEAVPSPPDPNEKEKEVLAARQACVLAAVGQEPPAKPKARVELRWVESKRVDGITEAEGFQATCDPKSIVYPHRKPSLVLTPAEVAEARITKHDFSGSGGPAELYSVTFHLTKKAREKLAATCDTLEMRELTIVVDGKYWGVHRYEKDERKPLIAAEARAETFTPSIGYITSKAEADRIVESCTPAASKIDRRVVQVRLPNEDIVAEYVEGNPFTVRLRAKSASVEGVQFYVGNGGVAVELKAHPSKGLIFQGKLLDPPHEFKKGSTVKVLPGYKRWEDLTVGAVYIELLGVTFELPDKK